tara:strand:- start:20 stop:808 length:789 start_codon:yes stop_codon:yes gene_type:complete
MSIIQSTREARQRLSGHYKVQKKDVEPTQNPKILDLTLLRDYADKVCAFHKTKDPDVKEAYRKWSYVFDWPIANVLGKVDEPTWVFMLERNIEWAIDSREAIQPNGRWQVWAHEVKIEERVKTRMRTVGKDAEGRPTQEEESTIDQYLVLGVQFIDVRGNEDLVYDMGRPTTKKDQFDPAILKELMANAPVKVDDSKLQEQEAQLTKQADRIAAQDALIAEMKAEQAKTNDMMAALLVEMKEQRRSSAEEPKAPAVKRRKRS